MAFFEGRREGGELALSLKDSWRAASIPAIRDAMAGLELEGVTRVRIDAGTAAGMDLAGTWQLNQLLHQLKDRGLEVEFSGPPPQSLHLVQEALELEEDQRPAALRQEVTENPVDRLGRTAVERFQDLREGLAFIGEVASKQLRVLGSVRRMRLTSIVRHVWDTGITAIPIVSLIAFLLSVIIAYLSASQLRNYGADIYVVDLITVGVLRELGVLLTAIIVAGRTGSAFAAEIGSMKLNDEIDALDATGVDPVETLILPRVIGLVIALPLLTFVADIIGLLGGALLSFWLLGMPLEQFMSRANEAIGPTTFWVGIAKAPVFALLIALSGAFRGLQVRGSSRELGRLVTMAVVQSIFLILLADALFAVLFMKLDI
jgi:phospholipid/cholesterol/gamma-HCH transport system permease protein